MLSMLHVMCMGTAVLPQSRGWRNPGAWFLTLFLWDELWLLSLNLTESRGGVFFFLGEAGRLMSRWYLWCVLVSMPRVPGLSSSHPTAGKRAVLIKHLPMGPPLEIKIKNGWSQKNFRKGTCSASSQLSGIFSVSICFRKATAEN